jgi:hypothetical protein
MRAATDARSASGIGMGMVALLVVTAILGLYSVLVVADVSQYQASGPTEGLAGFCGEKFGGLKSN